jgi:hypothetical protein
VYGDVSPDNVVRVGVEDEERWVWIDWATYRALPDGCSTFTMGITDWITYTRAFCSIRVHRFVVESRQRRSGTVSSSAANEQPVQLQYGLSDDIEALLYTVLYLCTGRLPWGDEAGKDDDAVLRSKERHRTWTSLSEFYRRHDIDINVPAILRELHRAAGLEKRARQRGAEDGSGRVGAAAAASGGKRQRTSRT